MKKKLSVISLLLIVAVLFSGCGSVEEHTTAAEQMLECLSNYDLEGAKTYLSSRISEESMEEGLRELADSLHRRTVDSMKITNLYVGLKTEIGYSGIERRVNYRVVLSDGTEGELQTVHYSGQGFVSFYLSLEDSPEQPDNKIYNV